MAADAKINTRCFTDVLFLTEGVSANTKFTATVSVL